LPALDRAFLGIGGADLAPLAPPPPTLGSSVRLVDHPGSAVAWVGLVIDTPGTEQADRAAVELALEVLVLGEESRAQRAMRQDSGLSYGLQVAEQAFASHGRLLLWVAVEPSRAGEAMVRLHAATSGILLKPASPEELARAWVGRQAAALSADATPAARAPARGGDLAAGQPPGAGVAPWRGGFTLAKSQGESVQRWLSRPFSWVVLGDAATLDPVLRNAGFSPDEEVATMAP